MAKRRRAEFLLCSIIVMEGKCAESYSAMLVMSGADMAICSTQCA